MESEEEIKQRDKRDSRWAIAVIGLQFALVMGVFISIHAHEYVTRVKISVSNIKMMCFLEHKEKKKGAEKITEYLPCKEAQKKLKDNKEAEKTFITFVGGGQAASVESEVEFIDGFEKRVIFIKNEALDSAINNGFIYILKPYYKYYGVDVVENWKHSVKSMLFLWEIAKIQIILVIVLFGFSKLKSFWQRRFP